MSEPPAPKGPLKPHSRKTLRRTAPSKPHDSQAHHKPHGEEPKKMAPWLRMVVTWCLLLTVSFLMERVQETTSREGMRHLREQNDLVLRQITRMQPLNIASLFYQRLLLDKHEPTFSHWKWDAPFNTSDARRRIGERFPEYSDCDVGGLTASDTALHPDYWDRDGHPCRLVSPTSLEQTKAAAEFNAQMDFDRLGAKGQMDLYRSQTAPAAPSRTGSDSKPDARAQAAQALAFDAALDGISLHSPDTTSAMDTALALPDGYLSMIRAFFPRTPIGAIVSILVLYSTLTLLLRGFGMWAERAKMEAPGCGSVILVMVLFPLVMTALAWVLRGVALGATQALHHLLAAPALSVVASSVATPPLTWVGGKITEHHLVEAALRRVLGKAVEE